ncbi:MAG: glycerate kinase [Verrucomicrobiae bacterium]|nr:glycerate kinase [Verrucomicrobiae bacterium]
MKVLICFDKFKDSMTSQEAGKIVETVIRKQHPDWNVDRVALADGGEGFCEILTSTLNGDLEKISVPGSLGQPVQALLGWVKGSNLSPQVRQEWELKETSKIAIIEMAQATGLQELPLDQRDCWKTTSRGTGELIKHAIDQGAETILLGVGGSSTNDLGLGVLEALGLRFLDDNRQPIEPIRPEVWKQVSQITGSIPGHLPSIKIACDVENPLFGPLGAATVYGPQKGLKAEDHAGMEELGKKMARLLCD